MVLSLRNSESFFKKELSKKEEDFQLFESLQEGIPLKNKIPHICMGRNIYLIDYENVPTIPKAISQDADSITFIFIGKNQKVSFEKKTAVMDLNSNYYFINMDKTMKNYLDIFMSCWIGSMISIYTPKSIRIVSHDKGFQSTIEVVRVLGFDDIEYLDFVQECTLSKDKIKKIILDAGLCYGGKTMKFKSYKSTLKKMHPQWTDEDCTAFFKKATKLSYIRERTIGNILFLEILI